MNVDSFIDSTLVERIWSNGAVVSSDFVVSHLSDVLRFLVLRRFGGIYVDNDVVFLKPLPEVFNFVGRESWTHPFVGNEPRIGLVGRKAFKVAEWLINGKC